MRTTTMLGALAALCLTGGAAYATDYQQDAIKLILKATPSGEKAVLVSKTPPIQLPADDPAIVGATFTVVNPGTGESATLPLPAAGWKSNPAGTVRKFVNKEAPGGLSAVKVAVVKSGSVLKVVAKSSVITLDEPAQGALGAVFAVGGDRWCITCGTPKKDLAGTFIAKGCLAAASCPGPSGPACGDGNVDEGETCDDGNTSDADACPADCVVDPCTPALGSSRVLDVNFTVPAGQSIAGLTVLVDYPEGKVGIPGSGGTASSRITNLPPGAFATTNDFDHAVRQVLASANAIPGPRAFSVDFENCQGAPAPTAGEFGCTVEDAADEFGTTLSGVTCAVVVP